MESTVLLDTVLNIILVGSAMETQPSRLSVGTALYALRMDVNGLVSEADEDTAMLTTSVCEGMDALLMSGD